jgi:hypothetical protein
MSEDIHGFRGQLENRAPFLQVVEPLCPSPQNQARIAIRDITGGGDFRVFNNSGLSQFEASVRVHYVRHNLYVT